MEKLSAKEILEKVQEKMSIDEFAYRDYDVNELGLGPIKEVDSYGGEDQGSTWYIVQYFEDHDVYIKTNGYYSSYDGTYFDEGYGREVKPVQKTITVFE